MRDRMSEIFRHLVTAASRAPRFPTTWSRNDGLWGREWTEPKTLHMRRSCHSSLNYHYNCSSFYKITKIVRALWLAERSVCMRVCEHGCDVKMFCLSCANHASTNLKKFLSSKLDKFTLFTHSFVGWNVNNRYKERVSIFLRLSWHFKRENSVFCKASFCKTRIDYACKTSWTRFCDW